jgi:hypothetical protein
LNFNFRKILYQIETGEGLCLKGFQMNQSIKQITEQAEKSANNPQSRSPDIASPSPTLNNWTCDISG